MEAPFIPPRSSSIRQPVDQYKHTQQVDRHSVTSSSPPLPQANNCQQPPSDISTRRADARRSTRDPQHQRDFLVYIQREIGAGNLPRNLHQYSPGARGHLLKEAYRVYLTRQSNATPTTPGSPVHTLKRKASDTELEGSARGPPPRYTPGASAAEAIDLTSPPRYSSMSTTQQRQSHRHSSPTQCRPSATSSPVVLPPWQPDADALQCPCCFTEFGWVTRKHHCRKCGRVVCSSCSTHRIAIPSKYQVHPPETNTTAAFPSFFNVSPEQSRHPGRQDHLSDVTEKTRVCDPWYVHACTIYQDIKLSEEHSAEAELGPYRSRLTVSPVSLIPTRIHMCRLLRLHLERQHSMRNHLTYHAGFKTLPLATHRQR